MKIIEFGSVTMRGNDLIVSGFTFDGEGKTYEYGEAQIAIVNAISAFMQEKIEGFNYAFIASPIAPPVAAGSVDTPIFRDAMIAYINARSDKSRSSDVSAEYDVLIKVIDAWGAQQREQGKAEQTAFLKECLVRGQDEFNRKWKEQNERAEKAEAALAVELERVQDYYTRWRCERENPTNTHRLDTWQAACGKARSERDKAEASVKDLEADAMRWRYLRDLDHDLTGTAGQPCVAIPDGASSGHYATGEDAVTAVDRAMGKRS